MNRTIRLTTFPTDTNWIQGYVREKKFYAKLFDEWVDDVVEFLESTPK